MTDIHYKQLPAHLRSIAADGGRGTFDPVFLIYGDEYLCKIAFETLMDALLPDARRNINFEPMDGDEANVGDALQRVNTYSLLPGRKVVAFMDTRIFHNRQDSEKILASAKKSYDADDMKKAARTLLKTLALLNLSLSDMQRPDRMQLLFKDAQATDDFQWVDALLQYCLERQWTVPADAGQDRMLQRAIEKGFPPDNHLIITSDVVDKRKRLYKLIREKGWVIDCSVPSGGRKAEKDAQQAVLLERMASVLEGAGKTADRKAYQAMVERTGFDLRTFVGNLEKLISYVGDRTAITQTDVQKVLQRTRKDPIYEFTNAVTDKRLDVALFYMHTLLTEGDIAHPLQLLGAIVNQMRRLLVIKGFMAGAHGRLWYANCPYPAFQRQVMEAVKTHDQELRARIDGWQSAIETADAADSERGTRKKKGKKSRQTTDLTIAKNPKSAFPVYQMFKKAEHFTTQEIVSDMHMLSRADRRMKSTGTDPKRILEQVLFSICRSLSTVPES